MRNALIILFLLLLTGCSNTSEIEELQNTVEVLEETISSLEMENEELTTEKEQLTSDYEELERMNLDNEDLIKELTANLETFGQSNFLDSSFFNSKSSGISGDLDNDGIKDYNFGGTDRDTDGDGIWDYDKGGTDRDLNNDGVWDY